MTADETIYTLLEGSGLTVLSGDERHVLEPTTPVRVVAATSAAA